MIRRIRCTLNSVWALPRCRSRYDENQESNRDWQESTKQGRLHYSTESISATGRLVFRKRLRHLEIDVVLTRTWNCVCLPSHQICHPVTGQRQSFRIYGQCVVYGCMFDCTTSILDQKLWWCSFSVQVSLAYPDSPRQRLPQLNHHAYTSTNHYPAKAVVAIHRRLRTSVLIGTMTLMSLRRYRDAYARPLVNGSIINMFLRP